MPRPHLQPLVRGTLLLARLAFMRSQESEHLLERILARLARKDEKTLRHGIEPYLWYPLKLQRRLDDAIASTIAPDDRPSALIEIGRVSAEYVIGRLDSPSALRNGPAAFLDEETRSYREHYSPGRRGYRALGEQTAVVRTFDIRHLVSADDCWRDLGWLQRGLELAGAEAALVSETMCRSRGAPCCEFWCEWSTTKPIKDRRLPTASGCSVLRGTEERRRDLNGMIRSTG